MELRQSDLDYFKRGEHENPTFWWRIGGLPSLQGKSVLDVGCGLGSLCVDMARAGAARVVGIDVDARLVEFARENARRSYPVLMGALEFRAVALEDFGDERFDIVTSKDAFEHVLDLPSVLAAVRDHLRPGGRLYAGWGPLYHSPFGDHGRMRALIPWGHVLIPERFLLRRLSRMGPERVESVADLALNKLALADYHRMFRESGLEIISMRVNRSTNPLSRVFSLLMRLPGVEKYFAHNVYGVFERRLPEGVDLPHAAPHAAAAGHPA